jgi:hypothetical protein
MKNMFMVFTFLVSLTPKLLRRGGMKALIAENLLLKQQLFLLSRSRKRAPNLSPPRSGPIGPLDHLSGSSPPQAGGHSRSTVYTGEISPSHGKEKNRWLSSSPNRKKPGPKGPSREVIELVLEMKRRNPDFGYTKIAEHISKSFALSLDKDVVRRILITDFRPERDGVPSWLSFIGQTKDSLWSIDFPRCESLRRKTHWGLVVMEQCTRRIIGIEIHPAPANRWESTMQPFSSGHVSQYGSSLSQL